MDVHKVEESSSILDYLSPPRTAYATIESNGATAGPNFKCNRLLQVFIRNLGDTDVDAGAVLADILLHSNAGIASSLDRRCVLLQLCLAVLAIHMKGESHGAVTPYAIRLAQGGLLTLSAPGCTSEAQTDRFCSHQCEKNQAIAPCQLSDEQIGERDAAATASGSPALRNQPCQTSDTNTESKKVFHVPAPEKCYSVPSKGLYQLTEDWRKHRMSNLEYLMCLNWLAGRTGSDLSCLPLLPWVIDFSCDPRPGLEHRCAPITTVVLLNVGLPVFEARCSFVPRALHGQLGVSCISTGWQADLKRLAAAAFCHGLFL
jgi:hypothetical protein